MEDDYQAEEFGMEEMVQLIELKLQHNPLEAQEQFRQYVAYQQYLKKGKVPELAVYKAYLKARFAQVQEHHIESIDLYRLAIHEMNQCPEMLHTNILCASYYGISKNLHRLNRLNEALKEIENGLNTFQPNGLRTHFYYLLYINQASILEKRNEDYAALQLIESIWNHQEYLNFSDARLNLYQIRVELLNKLKDYTEAIRFAQEGLMIARLDQNVDRQFELLSSLGEAYAGLGSLQKAIGYFQEACELEEKIKRKSLAITTYTQQGRIYLQQKKYEKAEKYVRHAVEMGTQDEYRLCKALDLLGEIFYEQKKYDQAHPILQRAWLLSQKLELDDLAYRTLVLLANISRDLQSSGYMEYMDALLHLLTTRRNQGGEHMVRTLENDPPDG